MKTMAPFVCCSGKTTTGRVGISLRHSKRKLGGKTVVKRFYVVRLGGTTKAFSLDSLGQAQAWREAVRCRERYERAVQAKRASLPSRRERQRGYLRKWKAKQRRPLNNPSYHAAYYQKNKAKVQAYRQANVVRDNARRRQRNQEKKGGA